MTRKLRPRLSVSLWILLLLAVSVSCTSGGSKIIPLASFTENDVEVSIFLAQESGGNHLLNATYTPPKGYHLYGKDIPAEGVNGLGRPTLLELTSDSLVKSTGMLLESAQPGLPDFEPRELLVYPAGAVTLSLPVKLPPGDQWMEDELSVTYMACSASQCKPPVVGKIIRVRIPGVEAVENE